MIDDIDRCVTMDCKRAGDRVYVLGRTRNEMGGSAYYAHLGYIGPNVPQVRANETLPLYEALAAAVSRGLAASVHGVYRGGLGVHLAMVAMGGHLGMKVDLGSVPTADGGAAREDAVLFSESPGRFIVTVPPECCSAFENTLSGTSFACVGSVTDTPDLVVRGLDGGALLSLSVTDLKSAWKGPFGDLV